MEKIDLKKILKSIYSARESPEILDVPEGLFLTYSGRGAPGGKVYSEALNALYSTAYTLKFDQKKKGRDFSVMALEGLWWWDDESIVNLEEAPPRETWNWTSMIRVPDFVTKEMVEELKPGITEKKGLLVDRVILDHFHEGLSAQILHVGPYSDESRTQKILHGFIKDQNYKLRGKHHEVYLSDPNRTAPEKLKTILRHPVEKRL
ncbi:MAG: GyrI-like domain-containing protein [Candidatus Bathyarchaeota archaeon]|nr:GyrI-like domain-containing protein [Candidatus Bathyarchaeota archaeon]